MKRQHNQVLALMVAIAVSSNSFATAKDTSGTPSWMNEDEANGVAAMAQGAYDLAIKYLESARATVEKRTKKSNDLASILGKIAKAKACQYKFDEAESLYHQAIEMYDDTESAFLTRDSDEEGLADLYETTGRYAEAERLLKKSAERWKSKTVLGIGYGKSLGNLGSFYLNWGRLEEAESTLRQSVSMLEDVYKDTEMKIYDDLSNFGVLKALARAYQRQGRYKEAEDIYLKIAKSLDELSKLEMPQKIWGPSLLTMQMNMKVTLGKLYLLEKRYEDAATVLVEGLAYAKAGVEYAAEQKNVEFFRISLALFSNFAMCTKLKGNLVQAKEQYGSEFNLKMAQDLFGNDSAEFAQYLIDYADCFVREGDFANAESLLRQSRGIAGEIYSQDNPFWQEAKALRFMIDPRSGESSRFELTDGELKEHNELVRMKTTQDYSAIKTLDEVYRDYQSIFSKNDPRIGEAQVQLSIALMTSNGKSDLPLKAFDQLKPTADGFLQKASSKSEQVVPKGFNNEKVFAEYMANTFTTLACVLGGIGDRTKAMEAVLIAGRLTMEPAFDHPPQEAVPRLLRLSQYAQWLGEYGYSEQLISYSKNLCEKQKNKELLCDCLFVQARLELLIGKFDISYKTAERGLSVGMPELSKEPKKLLDYYQLLAATAHASKRKAEAVKWSRAALDSEGVSDAEKVESLTLLLSVEFDDGGSEGSKSDGLEKLKQLISTRLEGLSPSTLSRAEEIIALHYLRCGDLEQSRRRFGQALRWIDEDKTLDGSLTKVRCLGSLAMLEERTKNEKWTKKDEVLAKKYALQASQILQEFVSNTLPSLSFPEQCAFLGTLERQKDVLLNVCSDAESIEGAYGYLLPWKGLLIETLRRDALINSAASSSVSARSIIDNQRKIMHDIAQLSAVGRRSSSTSKQSQIASLLDDLSAEKRRNELKIANELGVSIQDPLAAMGPDGFAKLLGPDEIFMDTMQYRSMLDNKLHYAAVLSRPAKPPSMVDLGSSEDIDKLIRIWRFSVTGDPNELNEDERADANLANWRLSSKQTSSGGNSNRAIRLPNNVEVPSEVVAQRTSELSSLLFDNQKLTEIIGQTKRIWFCPEGNLARIPWMAIGQLSDHKELQISDVDSPREFALLKKKESKTSSGMIVLAGIKNFETFGLPALKYSLDEIEEIRTLRDPSVVRLLAEEDATKEKMLSLLPSSSVVHIATHGFVAKGSEMSGEQPTENMTVTAGTRSGEELRFVAVAGNPLLNCGLLFAQPTMRKSKKEADDSISILTAQEIAELRFENCDLVTLSACQTGLGEGLNGQGIVGLRSAFLGAGANSVMMSLWDVDDASTCQLMKRFYSHMWGGSKSKIDALKAAQADLCNDESHPEWKNPKYWAGWVITGDGWKRQ